MYLYDFKLAAMSMQSRGRYACMPVHFLSMHGTYYSAGLGFFVVQTVRTLACGAEGPHIEITFNQVTGKLSVLLAAHGYPTLFKEV